MKMWAALFLVLSAGNLMQIVSVSACGVHLNNRVQISESDEARIQVNRLCTLPASPGGGNEALPRYFFNSTSGRCEEFTYRGCGGNWNHFMTSDECNQHCNPNGCPPYCNSEYCSARDTRTSICTLTNPMDIPSCEPPCRITNCKACYYDDVVRPLPDTCGNCSSYPTVEQAAAGCYKDWFTCIRRRDSVRNPRGNVKSQERFKCYEYPCP